MSGRPNVVLLCADQWRGDALSHMGHPIVQTPWLDRLALRGASFPRAYSAVPSCIAARAALFTGCSQETHGRVGYRDGVAWDYPVTLAGEFTRHGYQTQAIGKMHVFPERSQLGFQNVVLHDGFLHYARSHSPDLERIDDYLPWLRERCQSGADYFDHGVNCNSNVARPWDKPEHLHPTNWTVTQGIDFLRRRDPRKPFFLFLSFHRPHAPYDPPAWAFEQYMDLPMPEAPVGDWAEDFAAFENGLDPECHRGTVAPEVFRRARAGYYGLITHIDHQINRFLEVLQERGMADDTYVCFLSDHGDLLGDHRLWRKSLPYEGSARVPFLLSGPSGSGIRGGIRPSRAVELRDLMPTLLDCAGLPVPETVEGRSVLPLARGLEVPWREHLHGEHSGLFCGGSAHWLTDGSGKYVWYSQTGREQLFDLASDPGELRDLARDGTHADALAAWRARLIRVLSGRGEGFVADGRLVPGRPTDAMLPPLSGAKGR